MAVNICHTLSPYFICHQTEKAYTVRMEHVKITVRNVPKHVHKKLKDKAKKDKTTLNALAITKLST